MIVTNKSDKNLLPHGINTGYGKLNDYKFDIIDLFLQNNELIKLLVYPDIDPWSYSNVSEKEKDKLIYKYIFPYHKNYNFSGDVKANLYIDFVSGRKEGSNLKNLSLIVDIVLDEECNKTINGTRDIIIMDIIDKELNNSRGLGIGQLQCQGFHRIIGNNYIAYEISYTVTDFN